MYLVGFIFAMWLATDGRIVRAVAGPKMKLKTYSSGLPRRLPRWTYWLCSVLQFPQFMADPLYLFRVWDGGMSFTAA